MNTNPYRIRKHLHVDLDPDTGEETLRIAYQLLNPNGTAIAHGMSWRVARHLADELNCSREIKRIATYIHNEYMARCEGSDLPHDD